MRHIEYGKFYEFFNKKPPKYRKIESLSGLNISYYNPEIKPAKTTAALLKRHKRYTFNVVVPTNSQSSATRHVYYYDSKKEAESEYKNIKLNFYDQLTGPYLKKIDSGKGLTRKDKETLLKIIDSF